MTEWRLAGGCGIKFLAMGRAIDEAYGISADPRAANRRAQAMSAGTAETVQLAQGEARQRGPKDAPTTGNRSSQREEGQ